jgi:tetratricopeptide (TPR) repeat protein
VPLHDGAALFLAYNLGMYRCLSILVLGGLLGTACWAQAPSESSSKQTAAESTSQQESQQADQGQNAQGADQPAASDQKQTPAEDKPGAMQRLKKHLKDQMSSGCVNAVGQHCWDKPPKDDSKKKDDDSDEAQQQLPANAPLPRSGESANGQSSGESSSRGTKIDLSPPPGEAPAPGVGDTGDVQEMTPWDPHKADKDVEVGDFYFKLKNYPAAESRYLGALHWQNNHATATFRLAETEEKLGKLAEARKYYAAYLKILPEGEFASKAQQGLERLKDKPDTQEKAEAK